MRYRVVELSDGSRITELLPESPRDRETIELLKKADPDKVQLGSEGRIGRRSAKPQPSTQGE